MDLSCNRCAYKDGHDCALKGKILLATRCDKYFDTNLIAELEAENKAWKSRALLAEQIMAEMEVGQ